MIIRVVVVLGLAYLAVDQFVLSKKGDDTATETVAVPAKRPRKRKNQPLKLHLKIKHLVFRQLLLSMQQPQAKM